MLFRKRRVPYIPQREATDCGAAALAMVLAFHRVRPSAATLREACNVSRDGCTAADIASAATRFGFDCLAFQLSDPLDVQLIDLPVIAFWNFDHFVVIEDASPKGWTILDPGLGRIQASLD